MLFPFPFEWYVYQFILLGLVLISIVGFKLDRGFQFLPKIDTYFSIFIILCFLSVLWAINLTLVWVHAFGWLLFLLWFIVLRSYISREDFDIISRHLFFFFVGCSIYIISVVILGHIETEGPWHQYFGNNSNNISVLASMSIPFIFYGFKRGKIELYFKVIAIVAIIYCAIVASSIAVLAAVIFAVPIFVFLEYFKITRINQYFILGFYLFINFEITYFIVYNTFHFSYCIFLF